MGEDELSPKLYHPLCELELHETLVLAPDLTAMRVPGGWNYLWASRTGVAMVFVPYKLLHEDGTEF